MPQLDYIIVFSQIFWLFFIFSIFYAILTHFFLPIFIKSIKSRKQLIDLNLSEVNNLKNQIAEKQLLLKQILLTNLILSKSAILNEVVFPTLNKNSSTLQLIDEQISFVLCNTILYCDSFLLDFISFDFKPLNLKFN